MAKKRRLRKTGMLGATPKTQEVENGLKEVIPEPIIEVEPEAVQEEKPKKTKRKWLKKKDSEE